MLQAVETQITPTAMMLTDMLRSHGHRPRFIMKAGVLVEPLYLHQNGRDYYCTPRDQDNCFVPAEAERAAGLVILGQEAGGYEVLQQIIVHDMEEFESYKVKETPEREPEVIELDNDYEVMERRLKAIFAVIVAVGAAVLSVLWILAQITAAAAVAVDPALVLVIEEKDGTQFWFEVANWPAVEV